MGHRPVVSLWVIFAVVSGDIIRRRVLNLLLAGGMLGNIFKGIGGFFKPGERRIRDHGS
jgi:hypothetical protein